MQGVQAPVFAVIQLFGVLIVILSNVNSFVYLFVDGLGNLFDVCLVNGIGLLRGGSAGSSSSSW